MSAAAIIVLRRKRFIRAFREAGATDREHAITLEQAGQRHSWIFEQMTRHGVFVAVADRRYFLNERAAHAFQTAYRKRALVYTGVFLLLFLLLWLAGRLK